MNKALTLIGGAGIGVGLMYFFDHRQGKRRRARVRDKVTHVINKAGEAFEKTSRDLGNRAEGLVAGIGYVASCAEVDDDVLVARVRSKLGRVVSHPRAISVAADHGRVTLAGPVLASEADRLLKSVRAVRGVKVVVSHLEIHASADNVPALQGGRKREGEAFPLLQANWSPTARLLAGAAGGALVAYGIRRRDLAGGAAGLLGVAIVSRAAANVEMARILGLSGRRGVDIRKTINIAAPVEEVFEFWSHHENFPGFMRNVREVRKTGDGRYHWKVAGPAGIVVEWDGRITDLVPNELLAFESLPGALVEQQGIVRFEPITDSDTCVDIRMSYNPPAGALGHLIALLFGSDPKSEIDEDLMRMKSMIETGMLPNDALRKAAAREGRG